MKPIEKDSYLWESEWYAFWQKHGFFRSSPSSAKKPYSIVMPPPNITGILHMGHVLNNTVQDVLARRARMQGRETCWVPGMDHASIATEAKVIALLKEKGLSKQALGREGFLKEVFHWKQTCGHTIMAQLKRLGVSCDWDRMQFTMNPALSKAVIKSFVDLYDRGLIYRDKRIIHWDVARKTALSNEEVFYREEETNLYYIAYKLVDGLGNVTIATTRPETLLGDTALCVHPEDPRYHALHGKQVYVPLIDRVIPIIVDNYVDSSFGTGCLKVTPAHDANDYMLARKHTLPVINIFTEDGKINKAGGFAIGKDRFEAREEVLEALRRGGQLTKVSAYKHTKGYSERSHTIVEPRLSTQWFVRMKELAKPAIDAVKKETITFYPAKYVNTYMAWMNDIRDWCISRQLWWGHRIPVYYMPSGEFVVANDINDALARAHALGHTSLLVDDLKQDPDVLDTWFSSWLWPFSVFEGTTKPNNEDICYYYPTQDLVTAPEIIFFWVARMIMAGYAFLDKPPFERVYFTGIVRDKQRRKMSKSLGNSPDPMLLMDKYGADGVRAGVLFAAPAGNDLLFDEKLCEQGSKFAHKVAHALRLVQSWTPEATPMTKMQHTAIRWFTARFYQAVTEIGKLFKQYRLSQALIAIYTLIWDDFCARYLEIIKPKAKQPKQVPQELYAQTCSFFEQLMKLLHPFMPFITEKVWHGLAARGKGDSIVVAACPTPQPFDETILQGAQYAFELVATLRQHKAEGSTLMEGDSVLFLADPTPDWLLLFEEYVLKVTNLTTISHAAFPAEHTSFVIGDVTFALSKKAPSRQALMDQLTYQRRFLANVSKKLATPEFIASAPSHVVAKERQKKHDIQKRIDVLLAQLKTAI